MLPLVVEAPVARSKTAGAGESSHPFGAGGPHVGLGAAQSRVGRGYSAYQRHFRQSQIPPPRISMPAGTSIVDISHLRLLVHQRPVASASEEIVRSHCDDLDALREALREHFAPSVDTARWETISIPSPSAVPRPACVPGSMATPGTPISSTLAGSTPRTAAYQPSTDSRLLTTSTGRTSWMRDVSRSPTP